MNLQDIEDISAAMERHAIPPTINPFTGEPCYNMSMHPLTVKRLRSRAESSAVMVGGAGKTRRLRKKAAVWCARLLPHIILVPPAWTLESLR